MRHENEILDALSLKRPIIWIKTIEEGSFLIDLIKVLTIKYSAKNLYTWSIASPLMKVEPFNPPKAVTNNSSFEVFLNHIRTNIKDFRENQKDLAIDVFMIKDAHMIIDKPNAIRGIRDLYEQTSPIKNYYYPMIMISPMLELPIELEHLVTVIDYSTPNKQEIKNLVEITSSKLISKGYSPLTSSDMEKIINNLYGLTLIEIKNIISESIKKEKTIKLEYISKAKINALKKTGLLDYKIPKNSINDIGGNDTFKAWVEEVKICMTKEARDFGLAIPKGYLSLGLPGTSKTFAAEAMANELNMPFISLDMSKIMHKHIGQSERNMSRALELIESCAPCVLLIDEVEKALSGIQSQGKSDGGTLARTFGSILQFLNKDNEVFTVMTSNDVSQLPPELTRAGRLDAIWFFPIPTAEERAKIFEVHLSKKGESISDKEINEIVKLTNKYTGAEIEQIVKVAHTKAFLNKVKNNGNGKITINELKEAVNSVIPVYKSSREKMDALEHWAKGRALYANKENQREEYTMTDEDWELEIQ